MKDEGKVNRHVVLTVVISALGYFVDIYDLLLFGIVRVPSLRDLGVPEAEIFSVGVRLLNYQMAGMLIGGIVWGVLGDLRGRKSVLFGSILLYSLANIANAYVPNAEVYAWLRLAAGIGLAGELGAAVTLVSEVMSRQHRGMGTAIVAGVGILGAVFAALVGDYFTWKVAYLVGGSMGLALLALRAGLLESGMFNSMAQSASVARGRFHHLFTDRGRFVRYMCCILIGVPVWYVIGILIVFAPELSKELGVTGAVTGGKAIMWSYLGLSIGDISAGLLSQWLKSRRKAVFVFLGLTTILIFVYVSLREWSVPAFYALCATLGFGAGYWAVFVTIGAEQFGTNIRATVATSVPNFVRGSVVPVTMSFEALSAPLGLIPSALTVGLVVMALAFAALYFVHETYGKDLDYYEA